jgi:hypothetical protein
MAERVLDAGAQLSERAMIFGDEEERIVTEASRAPIFPDDHAVAAALGDGVHLAIGPGKCSGANVVGRAFVVRKGRQLGQ